MNPPPEIHDDADALAKEIVARVGPDIRLALPLGLGKANTVANALTRLAERDGAIRLEIFTALTLERPDPGSELGRRFIGPARDRLFGAYPGLRYTELLRAGAVPDNITVHEFFFLAGNWIGSETQQRNYITANYTHALPYLAERRPNVIAQLLAHEGGARYSLSCNTDISADLIAMRARGAIDFLMVGELNDELPFMPGPAAEIDRGEVDLLLDDPATRFELFSALKQPVSLADHAIGLHVARLIPDGGTLQIGIGAIGDAVAAALGERHRDPGRFRQILRASPFAAKSPMDETAAFETGLYAVTEMLVEGLLELFEAGIIRREAQGAKMHAAFFVDCRNFYRRLREMPRDRRAEIAMTPVSFTNELYGDEAGKRAARRDARFVNAAMKATALGGVVSDVTRNGRIVSGVGGQYNFVAQAHALESGRSIITLPSTRRSGGKLESNIVWDHPHETVPRHLRDIVVTEYGVADLRGKPDAEAVTAMIAIADSRFQDGILRRAKVAGKVPADWQIPPGFRVNTPRTLENWLQPWRDEGLLPRFPLGTDMTEVEQDLAVALDRVKMAGGAWRELAGLALRGARPGHDPQEAACLSRMGLAGSAGMKERLMAWIVRGALRRAGGPHASASSSDGS